jgi:hypothetical protein
MMQHTKLAHSIERTICEGKGLSTSTLDKLSDARPSSGV